MKPGESLAPDPKTILKPKDGSNPLFNREMVRPIGEEEYKGAIVGIARGFIESSVAIRRPIWVAKEEEVRQNPSKRVQLVGHRAQLGRAQAYEDLLKALGQEGLAKALIAEAEKYATSGGNWEEELSAHLARVSEVAKMPDESTIRGGIDNITSKMVDAAAVVGDPDPEYRAQAAKPGTPQNLEDVRLKEKARVYAEILVGRLGQVDMYEGGNREVNRRVRNSQELVDKRMTK